MRKITLSLSFVLCFLVISVLAQAQLQKIFFHPKAAGTEKQTKFVDSIRIIPLEVHDGVELTNFNNVEVTSLYFLIKDYANKKIYFYAKDGSFIKQLSYKKLGDGFYPTYHEQENQLSFFGNNKNYSLTPKDRLKIQLDRNNPRNRKYFKKFIINLNDTSFTIKKAEPTENDIIEAFPLYADFYGQGEITTSELFNDSLDYEFKLYRNNNFIKGFFPYNHINETKFLFTEENITVNKTDIPFVQIISRPFCDTIYKMVRDSLFPAFQLVMPLENSIPASFFQKPFKNKTERENFRRNNGSVFRQVYNFYETPRFIYFSIGFLSNFESYIYQKQTNTTSKVKNIKGDSTHYNLQLLSEYGLSRKNGRFYKPQKAGDLINFFAQNKNVQVPHELKSYLETKPPPGSPLIVEFKFKD
jgi:hypothetical protein